MREQPRIGSNIETNGNNALTMTQQPTPPNSMAVRADFGQAVESSKIRLEWPAGDALNSNPKAPLSVQPSTLASSRTSKTAALPCQQGSRTIIKSMEPSSCHFVPRPLPHVNDHLVLSEHQIFLRQQIEVFCATEADLSVRARGRNKRITLGQVGIRCRYCAHLPCRQKGSLYYPSSTLGLYQAAQNMSTSRPVSNDSVTPCPLCALTRDALYPTVLPLDTMEHLIRIARRMPPETPPRQILQCWRSTAHYFCYTRPFHIHSHNHQDTRKDGMVVTAASVVFLQSHILFNLALCWLLLAKLAGSTTSLRRAGHLYY
jgi:hypothetical protein